MARREIIKRDAEFEAKLKAAAQEQEARIKHEARLRDEDRARKIKEFERKTEELLEAQFALAESSRKDMLEREARVKTQLEEKKTRKKLEMSLRQQKAEEMIGRAIMNFVDVERRKKEAFEKKKEAVLLRTKEMAAIENLSMQKKIELRDKNERKRYNRLLDAYGKRNEYREHLSNRLNAKNTGFEDSQRARDERAAMAKFLADLKMQEKRDNVERISRVNEFRRLQILRRIQADDGKYDHIQEQKRAMMDTHKQEVQTSLIRKHEVINAMETMRSTNDFTLLDKLYDRKAKRSDDDRRLNDDDEVGDGVGGATR